ncbi:MAG: hypothetical protein ACRDOK_30405 [Streptosporangiaceae bacterium]
MTTGANAVDAAGLGVVRSRDRSGGLVVGIGMPLADVYLEFLGGRCRPNTVLAASCSQAPSAAARSFRVRAPPLRASVNA